MQEFHNYNESCSTEDDCCGITSGKAVFFNAPTDTKTQAELIYVGDPMCSWCWGLSPALTELRNMSVKSGLNFRVVVGGLRPGGGDRWDENRKIMLRQTWEKVSRMSGQAFSYDLLERTEFNYDTEPPCRAVLAARPFLGMRELDFFEAIQRKFYVESNDPADLNFYESICAAFDIDFNQFALRFNDDEVREETFAEFDLAREWGVQAFPSVILMKNGKRHFIAHGFSTLETMRKKIMTILDT